MLFTDQLRNEHDLLLGIADELGHVISGAVPDDLTPLFLILGRFNQLLQVHLVREDAVLYPAIIEGRDAAAALVASGFQEELGDLAARIEAFDRKWVGGQISTCWSDFCEDLANLLEDLRLRIRRENEELYPLIEVCADIAA